MCVLRGMFTQKSLVACVILQDLWYNLTSVHVPVLGFLPALISSGIFMGFTKGFYYWEKI